MAKCPGCDKRVSLEEGKSNYWRDGNWHHICQMKERGEYDAILALYHLQDDTDPETRIADLIGQIGHACDELNKRLRGSNRIDFAACVEQGLRYWEVERK
jgi:hypothetical protein